MGLGLAGVAGAVAWRASAARASASEPTVAIVNARRIVKSELDARVAEILPMASFHGSVDPARRLTFERTALDELVLDELIYEDAVDRGATVSGTEIDAELAKARARFANADEYAQALAESGLTERGYREELGRLLTITAARRARVTPAVADADVRAYYALNANRFMRPEEVRLREMLIRVDPSDPSSARPAERRARALAQRLAGGADFGRLARSESEDEYHVKDGDMGWVHRGRLDADLERAVFAAPTRSVQVARSLYGFHVFEVLERRPPTQLSLDEARPIIADFLRRDRQATSSRLLRESLLARARVEILDPGLRQAQPAVLPEFERPGQPGRPSSGASTSRSSRDATF